MLFNSYEFILVFLPATVLGFLLLGAISRSWALGWLILASLLFYAWWRPFNLWIIIPSLAVNYLIGRALLRIAADDARAKLRMGLLTLGIVFNICLLGYFKYANFAVSVANDISGSDFVLQHIILPLGISFITFQKIAFLIDIAGGRIKSFTLRDYLLFVLFFPQLIAGPIVHFNESVPQFQRLTARFDKAMFATAITLFCIGLFKKVVLADGIALQVTPVFDFAAAGAEVTLVQAWTAALGYTLQIYFDFSGYSDMACGAALFFGVHLPLNFDSPLKATNIIDFWLRWHVTLTRFLTAYVYNPLALALTRRRMAARKPMLTARRSKFSAFVNVLAFPTLATMLLSGVWHGAGYTFILWGLVHGAYLVINHAWRQYGPPLRGARAGLFGALIGWFVTLTAVVLAMVLFRAPNLATAANMFTGMLGLHGAGLPAGIANALGMPALGPMMGLYGEVYLRDFAVNAALLVAALGVAVLMPNSLQLLSQHKPVLHPPNRPPRLLNVGPAIYWRPTLPWLIFVGVLAAVAMFRLTGQSEFLYWQF